MKKLRQNNSQPAASWLFILFFTFNNLAFSQSSPWFIPNDFEIDAVVTDLYLPVNLAFVPTPLSDLDAPYFYISELYGTVKVVSRNFQVGIFADNLLNFSPVIDFPGSGESGVTGLVVDPCSGDLFVSMVYMDNDLLKNKVVRMFSEDGGLTMSRMKTIIDDIPSTPNAHQIQQLTIGPDKLLYVQVGDAFVDLSAQDDNDLRGKILRMNLDGSIPDDNPRPGSYVYAKGFRNPFGGAWHYPEERLYITDNGFTSDDRIVRVEAGGNHGWPFNMRPGAVHLWNPTVAPTAMDFCNGAGFPERYQGRLFVAQSGPTYHRGHTPRGKRIGVFNISEDGVLLGTQNFTIYSGQEFSTVVGLAFGADGLYFTDLYGEDGFDENGLTNANVYRIRYTGDDGIFQGNPSWERPLGFTLSQNYPNPFNPKTTIHFELDEAQTVQLKVYDTRGKAVATLVNDVRQPGCHEVTFDGSRFSSGIYIYKIRTENFEAIRKMILVK